MNNVTLKSVLTITLLFSFTCCFGQNASAKNVFGNRLLQSIFSTDTYNGSAMYSGTYEFTYNDAGQVTKIEYIDSKNDTETYTFDYTPGTINGEAYHVLMKDIIDGESLNCYLRLGKNNFVEYCYEEECWNGDNSVETWNFEYNADGQLCKMVRSEGENEVTVATYTDGDITNVKMTDDDGDQQNYNISYTSSTVSSPMENTDKIMMLESFGFDTDEMTMAYFAGLLGNPTKHLPVACTDEENCTDSFSWERNEQQTSLTIRTEGEDYQAAEYEFTWTSIPSNISTIKVDGKTDCRIYNINGTSLSQPQHGINIMNGKKVLVK